MTDSPAALVAPIAGRCRFCEAAFERDAVPDLDASLCSIACRDRDERGALLPHEHRLAEFHAGQKLAPEVLIADALGLTPAAWGRLRKTDRELREALACGRAREHQRLLAAMFDEAVNGGNVAAASFLLRCRHGYDDKSSDTAPRVNVAVVQLPQALSVEQWNRLRLVAGGRAAELKDVTPPPGAA